MNFACFAALLREKRMVIMVAMLGQRQSRRMAIRWPVSVWHPKAGRFIHGRSLDVSRGGALIELPADTPVQQGNHLEVNFPRAQKLASDMGQSARIKGAKVVRVSRNQGRVMQVAVKFAGVGAVLNAEPMAAWG